MAASITLCCGKPLLASSKDRIETSLDKWSCSLPGKKVGAAYASRNLGVVRCHAPAGYSLLLVSSDSNSWIDLHRGNLFWSSEGAVVYRQGAGMFPNITGRVVWLRESNGDWRGLVFTVASRDEADNRLISFFAVKTVGAPCLVGVFTKRSEAEASLRHNTACVEPLATGTD